VAFVVFILGMFLLFFYLQYLPTEVSDISGKILNSRVVISGKVVSERIIYSGTRLLEIEGGIVVLCECDNSFLGKNVRVVGKIKEYNGKRQVLAEEVILERS